MGQTLEDMKRELTVLRARLGLHDDPERPPALKRSDSLWQTSANFDSAETIALRVLHRRQTNKIMARMHKLQAAIEALNPAPPTLRDKVWEQILHDFAIEHGREPTLDERIIEAQGYIAQFTDMVERGLL